MNMGARAADVVDVAAAVLSMICNAWIGSCSRLTKAMYQNKNSKST